MSVCAVMLVKDEEDILPHTLRWLTTQVDEVVVMDNMSTDDSRAIALAAGCSVLDDREVGYFQSIKTTAMARIALDRGHAWVVPVDADEVWHTPAITTPIRDVLAGMPPDVQIVRAALFNHLPTVHDRKAVRNPFCRIGWRQRHPAPLGKVACRTRPDLVILAGNHSARTSGTALATDGLIVRHFSWRSPEQYVRKIRNGERAYAATDLPDTTGEHWRMWEGQPDEAIIDHYNRWFVSPDPAADDSLIFDPAEFACR